MDKKWGLWIGAFGLMALSSTASATLLQDNYYGSYGYGRGDVIGPTNTFGISSLSSMLAGNQLTVTVNTNFAGHAGVDKKYTLNNTGIGYGDLFLSTGWTPHGTGHYNYDNASNGNHWTYAFSLNDPLNNSGGSGIVYALNSGTSTNHNPDVLLSNKFINCGGTCIYRKGQAVAVNTLLATKTSNTGSWLVGNGYLRFTFDISGLNLDPSQGLGFHWDMYCGNDVIEGLNTPINVPEPPSSGIYLFGLGMIGLAAWWRRKSARG